MAKKKTSSSKKGKAPRKKAAGSKTGAAKKASAKKSSSTSKKRKKEKSPSIKRSKISVLMMTLGLFIVAGALAYVLLNFRAPNLEFVKKATPVQTKIAKSHKPRFEIFPVEPIPAKVASKKNTAKTPAYREPSVSEKLPRVAIIIDDIGYDRQMAEKLLNLGCVLTYSILPFSPFSKEIAHLVVKNGKQVMLHLPMEPNEYPMINPGKGVLLSSMTPDERIHQLELDLDAVPYIKGVNNHMGSKLTTMSDEMNQILSVLKKRGLFFIDSRTTAPTQCRSSAILFKVPFAERDVFLDHVQTRESIQSQIEQLIHIAEINGKAVGIGHPHELTYEVLAEKLPELQKRVKLIFASDIVDVL